MERVATSLASRKAEMMVVMGVQMQVRWLRQLKMYTRVRGKFRGYLHDKVGVEVESEMNSVSG